MRDTFIRTLMDIAKADRNVLLVTGDLGFGVLRPFWDLLPDQFINAGIAEQNMTSMAAGMAMEGKIVFTYSIGNFPTLRCLEQIRNDCAYHNCNVKIVCVGGGFAYGALGMSHHATEDIAIMRDLPSVTVVCPGDIAEAAEATKAIAEIPGTVYLRLGRGGEKQIHEKIDNYKIGKAIKIRRAAGYKNKVAVFSTGAILGEATETCNLLENANVGVEQYSFHTVKPIDIDLVSACAENCSIIATMEEHNIVGGFGSTVSEVLTGTGRSVKLLRFGIDDDYCSYVGDQEYLRYKYNLTAHQVYLAIVKSMK